MRFLARKFSMICPVRAAIVSRLELFHPLIESAQFKLDRAMESLQRFACFRRTFMGRNVMKIACSKPSISRAMTGLLSWSPVNKRQKMLHGSTTPAFKARVARDELTFRPRTAPSLEIPFAITVEVSCQPIVLSAETTEFLSDANCL